MQAYRLIVGIQEGSWRTVFAVAACWMVGCATTQAPRVGDTGNSPAPDRVAEAVAGGQEASEETEVVAEAIDPPATDASDDTEAAQDDTPPEVRDEHWDGGVVKRSVEGRTGSDGKFIRHGVTTTFYEAGQLKSKSYWVDGKPHGQRTTWYINGQIWSHGTYVNGRESGTWTRWYPDGGKHTEWHMRLGVWHGTYTEWHANGFKRLEVEFANGLRQGPQLLWDTQGVEVSKNDYVDNVEQP